MGKCIKCGVGFTGTAANPPGDGECHVCERDRLRKENAGLIMALAECITFEGSAAWQEGLGRQKRRLLSINKVATETLKRLGYA